MKSRAKCLSIVILILLFGMSGVQAANLTWSGANADANNAGFYDDPGNWNGGNIPTIADQARIYLSGSTVIVDDFLPDEKVCSEMRLGWGGAHENITVQVIAGTLRTNANLVVALRGAKNSVFQVDGGEVYVGGLVRSARDNGATASFIINGGMMETANDMRLSETATSGGASLIVNGGLLKVAGTLDTSLDASGGAPVTITLNGGMVQVGRLDLSSAASLEIKDGTLIVDGDLSDQVATWIAQGQLTGHGIPADRESVKVVYNAEQDKTTLTADISQVDLRKAWNPSPSGAGAALDSSLTWSAGDSTAVTQGHVVFLGEDADAVANDTAENTLGTYRGQQDGMTYPIPFELVLGKTYYWRIDQVQSDSGEVVKGSVWSFTVQPSLLIEGFDTYPLWSAENWDAHLQVWQQSGGADSYIVDDAAVDVNSLEVSCYPEMGEGDAVMTLPLNVDWTLNGIRALNLSFRGDPNVTELKVSLSDGAKDATVSVVDSDILHHGAWRSVDIDLAQFEGVDLSQVKQLSLAIAYNEGARINIDSIRVFSSRCVSDYGPAGDLNGDCVVDDADLNLLLADWLMSGYDVTAAEPSKDALLHYNMDQEASTMVTDSMGIADATLQGAATSDVGQIWDTTGGLNGSGCLAFNGELYMDVPTHALSTADQQITISLWINGADGQQPPLTEQRVIHAWMSLGHGMNFIAPNGNGAIVFQSGVPLDTTIWQDAKPADWEGGWTHYALVKDTTQGIQRMYRNGELVAENTNAYKPIAITSFTFGGRTTSARGQDYLGKLDDIRFYDVALPQAEVLNLAGGTTLKQNVFSIADINGDDVVDQADRDILEANMGTEKLWP